MSKFYDFHIHTALSPCGDNDMTPCNIVNMAYLKGLGAVAITDHNTIGNVASAMKVGKELGITVIPGMEIETEEEVHILSLFPTLDAAAAAEKYVFEHLPVIKNKPEIFGNQYYMDEDDNITGELDRLLIIATTMDIYQVFDMVKQCGGIAIPAHVDRHSYSVLSNLGFMPPDLDAPVIEISNNVGDLDAYLKNTKLSGYEVVRNSDAHNLGTISEAVNSFSIENSILCEILDNLNKLN